MDPAVVSYDYGLSTATMNPDGKKAATEYLGPETGQVTAQVADPAGLNLRTLTSYESSPDTLDAYKRPRSRTLPGASSSSTYTYYASGDTVPTSGCSGVSTQTGSAKQYTGPGSTPVQTRSLVDIHGPVVASQHVGDSAWNCTTHDTRGRLTLATDHAGGTKAQNDFSVAGQVTSNTTDSYGRRRTTVTKWDLLGRMVSYQDEHGTITRMVYDQAGRVTATYRQFAGQAEAQLTAMNYDDASRLKILTDHASGTGRPVYFSHDSYGRPRLISRPGSVTTETFYDSFRGRIDEVEHWRGDDPHALADSTYSRNPSGTIGVEYATVDGGTQVGEYVERNYSYDAAKRLTSVSEETDNPNDSPPPVTSTRFYRYDSRSNRCSTSATVTNCSDTAYEYNSADQLTQSPFASSYDWDDQNNRPGRLNDTVGANGHPSMNYEYDARDHTTVIDDGSTEVEETVAPSGRVLRRKVTNTIPSPDVITGDVIYGYAGDSDSPAYTRDLFTDDWNTANGAGTIWNATSWDADSNSTSKKLEIQGNEGAIWVSSTSTSARAATKQRQNADVRLDYRFGSSSASSELRVGLRSTGSSNPNNASYRVDINPTSSTIRLRKKVWGVSSATQLASFTYSANTNATPDKLRFRVTNDGSGNVLLQVKLWEGATEPATWNHQYTDSATDKITGAGTVEIAHSSSSATNTAYIDNLSFTDVTGTTATPLTTTYVSGPDGLLLTDVAGTPMYQLVNAGGDVVGSTDGAGAFTPALATDEFGAVTEQIPVGWSRLGWLGGRLRFTAHEAAETMRMGERAYDPNTGRFTSSDPVEGGSLNAFEYGGADPVNNGDLGGRSFGPVRNAPTPNLDTSGVPPCSTPTVRHAYNRVTPPCFAGDISVWDILQEPAACDIARLVAFGSDAKGINALFGLKPWYSTVWWVTGGTAGAYAHWACSNKPESKR